MTWQVCRFATGHATKLNLRRTRPLSKCK